MKISKKDLDAAFEKAGLSLGDSSKVWEALPHEKSLNFSNWLYYLGALVVISAMTWFLNLSWGWFSGGATLLLSLVYALIFLFLGHKLWPKEKTPAGLLITLAVCMTPLIIFSLGSYFKIIPEHGINRFSVRATMELGTVIAGLIALKYYPFPFLTVPIYFAAWIFLYDLTTEHITSAWTTLTFGLLLSIAAYFMEKSYAFWAYLFGTFLFWFGLSDLMSDQKEPILILYLVINVLMMALSVLLQQTILMVLGAFGAFIYLGHLAYTLFGDTIYFPISLGIIGLSLIYGGLLLQRRKLI